MPEELPTVTRDRDLIEQFVEELLPLADDPLHQRLVRAYGGPEPVASITAEFQQIVREILGDED